MGVLLSELPVNHCKSDKRDDSRGVDGEGLGRNEAGQGNNGEERGEHVLRGVGGNEKGLKEGRAQTGWRQQAWEADMNTNHGILYRRVCPDSHGASHVTVFQTSRIVHQNASAMSACRHP